MTTDPALPSPIFSGKSRLYRRYFTRAEIQRLDSTPPDSAASDIYLLRTLVRRLLASAQSGKHRPSSPHAVGCAMDPALKRQVAMLAAFCQVASTIASLARLEFRQQPEPPSALAQWAAALENEPL